MVEESLNTRKSCALEGLKGHERNEDFFRGLDRLGTEHECAFRGCESSFKGTVLRPDSISLRVVSLDWPQKGHQPLYVVDFLILILNI
jgi:hypothetical protein